MDKPLLLTLSPADKERFWAFVDCGEPDECWSWRGFIDHLGGGYPGGITIKPFRWRAAHISLFIEGKARPSQRHESLHSCDNPPCCNPSHLRWGTPEENKAEKKERQQNKRIMTT